MLLGRKGVGGSLDPPQRFCPMFPPAPLPAVSNPAPAGQSLGKGRDKGTKKGLYPCSFWQLSRAGLGLFREAAISG